MVNRRFVALAASLTLVLAACSFGEDLLTDPAEVLSQSVVAMTSVESVVFDADFTAKVSIAGLGLGGGAPAPSGTGTTPALTLKGTAAGGMDLASKNMYASFELPSMLGLNGEVRIIDNETFTRTSFTGPGWVRQDVEDQTDSIAESLDPAEVAENAREVLDQPGVDARMSDGSVECGESRCYQVFVDVDLAEAAQGALEDMPVASFGTGGDLPFDGDTLAQGEVHFVLLIDTESMHMVSISISLEHPDVEEFELSATFDYDAEVVVERPDEDEIMPAPSMGLDF